MRLQLVTAGASEQWEAALVRACQDRDLDADVTLRCHDLGDLVAAAASGQLHAAIVAAGLRWLDRDVVRRLGSAGLTLVAVIAPGDAASEHRLNQLGVHRVAPSTTTPAELLELARAASSPAPGDPGATGSAAAERMPAPLSAAEVEGVQGGRLITVWGPKGSPGRTTLAVNIAFEAAALGTDSLLVDADTYGGSVEQVLGFVEEHSGLATLARLAARGQLDAVGLRRATRRASKHGPRVVTGLSRAALWPELRPATWDHLLDLFRLVSQVTVLDVSSCLEEDEELVYDHVELRRNAVARRALEAADLVVAVVRADPIGVHEFVRAFDDLSDVGVEVGRMRIVVNGVRDTVAGGGSAAEQLAAVLERYLGVRPTRLVPYDRASLDAALAAGKALREVRPGSPAQRAIAALAGELIGVPAAAGGRRRRQPGRLLVARRSGA